MHAAILAHELTYVQQEQEGFLQRQDCLLAETEAHAAEVHVWRLVWRDQELPTGLALRLLAAACGMPEPAAA